ncbi:MAG: cyclic dehypoxanthinyl futalosine synthase [bacterium]|jgi:cyclic dehypoxanthinyl futalosine synthase
MMLSSRKFEDIYKKIEADDRISSEEALLLLREANWLEIVQLAAEKKKRLISPDSASYTMFRVVNYTSVCNIGCTFCSFKDDVDDKNAYTLSQEEVFEKIDHSHKMGADQVFFQGGVHPRLPLEYYTDILKAIKQKYGIHIRAFSPVELKSLAEVSNLSLPKLLDTLKNAGLDSVPGAGAEILTERVRGILSPKKTKVQEWADIMKECHRHELNGSANIVFGSVEKDYEIIEHLQVVRDIQDETGGFNTFIPWTFQPQTRDFTVTNIPHQEYLKVLGISRLFLDNIPNIEVSVMVLGKDIGKLALHMGANDISSPVLEENVLKSYGLKSEKQAIKLIQEAGLTARRRDFDYNYLA